MICCYFCYITTLKYLSEVGFILCLRVKKKFQIPEQRYTASEPPRVSHPERCFDEMVNMWPSTTKKHILPAAILLVCFKKSSDKDIVLKCACTPVHLLISLYNKFQGLYSEKSDFDRLNRRNGLDKVCKLKKAEP